MFRSDGINMVLIMGEFFHVIDSARKTFTREEWSEYCNATRHDDSVRIRTQIGKYLFNDHDICINPEVMSLVVKGGGNPYSVMLKWCDCGNGLWVYGLDYNTGDGGGGFGARFVNPDEKRDWLRGYPSERECKIAACDSAIKRLSHSFHKDEPNVKRLIAMVEDYRKSLARPKVVQLSLFD